MGDTTAAEASTLFGRLLDPLSSCRAFARKLVVSSVKTSACTNAGIRPSACRMSGMPQGTTRTTSATVMYSPAMLPKSRNDSDKTSVISETHCSGLGQNRCLSVLPVPLTAAEMASVPTTAKSASASVTEKCDVGGRLMIGAGMIASRLLTMMNRKSVASSGVTSRMMRSCLSPCAMPRDLPTKNDSTASPTFCRGPGDVGESCPCASQAPATTSPTATRSELTSTITPDASSGFTTLTDLPWCAASCATRRRYCQQRAA